jgi:hypothetical protein
MTVVTGKINDNRAALIGIITKTARQRGFSSSSIAVYQRVLAQIEYRGKEAFYLRIPAEKLPAILHR